MNVSVAWLRALAANLHESPQELANRLAAYGAAVDEIAEIGGGLDGVIVAHVLEARRHPDADRLSLCVVDAGEDSPLQVVCGAPNVKAGAFYPFIPAGGTLPGGVQIRRAKIRGQESNGMLCSARELGLGRDHEGILELHGEYRPGAGFPTSVGLPDTRLVVDVTPNRGDLLSHWGIARELATGGEAALSLPRFPTENEGARAGAEIGFVTGSPRVETGGISITIEDTVGCVRYYGVAIRGVRVTPSPDWLASRLRAVGLRPINNVVDATNYVLHELGQPLHAFDLQKLGPAVVVRRARAGETLVTLDGKAHELTPASLVIADAHRAVALAGVMGGLDTEVGNETVDVLLECALFDPRVTRDTRRAAGLSTDASHRFERGVDPDLMERSVRRAIDLIVALAGGTPASSAPVVDVGIPPVPAITLRPSRVRQVLGEEFEAESIRPLLEPIGFRMRPVADGALSVLVPGHRRLDVTREADLVEEVARRFGYDRFPDELRAFRPSAVPDDPMANLESRLRERFVGLGFLEARTAAFAPEAAGDVVLLLPLSAAESRLRRDLTHGLLRRVETNFNRGARAIRLFEIGTVFAPGGPDGIPREATRLAAVLTGPRSPAHWSDPSPTLDRWDLRGLLDELARVLHLEITPGADSAYAESADSWRVQRGTLASGWGGRVRATAIDAPPWADPVFALELTLELGMATREPQRFEALPAFPAVERDLALLVPGGLHAEAVGLTIRAAAGPLLEDVWPFDVYRGEGVSGGRVSIAFRLRFRAPDRTLVDADVDSAIERVLKRLQEEHRVERRA